MTRDAYTRVECYLTLLWRKRKRDNSHKREKLNYRPDNQAEKKVTGCELGRWWSSEKHQCDKYLELVRKVRLGGHAMNEYARDGARVRENYERLQRENGQIDFDTMLALFAQKVLGNEALKKRFRSMFCHIIVDEYQDNSEYQAAQQHC